MIPAFLIGGGIVYLYLTRMDNYEPTQPTDATEPTTPPPQPVPTNEDSYRVELVGTGDKNNIYCLESQSGLLYDDGTDTRKWSKVGFIRGDFPTGFTTASASVGGTIDFTINEMFYENVLVYKTKEDAIEADKEKETTPDSPVKPEEPKEEPQPTLPINPNPMPGLGGQWSGPLFGGGQ